MRLTSLPSLHRPLYPLHSPLHPFPSFALSTPSLSITLHHPLMCSIPLLVCSLHSLSIPLCSAPSLCSSLFPSLSPLLLYLPQRSRSPVTPSGTRCPWPAGSSVSLSAHALPQCALPRPWPSPSIPWERPSAGSPGSGSPKLSRCGWQSFPWQGDRELGPDMIPSRRRRGIFNPP